MKHLTILVSLVAGASLAFATPALAAAPSNDTFAGATTVILPLPFGDSVDTTDATTDADDTEANAGCGAPATDASVWYQLTPDADESIVVDASGSTYPVGVIVVTGTPGSFTFVACGFSFGGGAPQPEATGGPFVFSATGGVTYAILAFDPQFDGGGNGGMLNISFNEAPPPPTIDFSVNSKGTVNTKTGVATISGTFTCSNADFIDIFIDARQNVGRFAIRGFGEFFDFGTCDGSSHDWSAQIFPDTGKFAGGRMLTLNFAFACGIFECADGFVEQTVMLRGIRPQ